MNMQVTIHDGQFQRSREIAPDFGALVALLAASQAMLPTARLATRLESALRESSDRIAALIGIFAPRRGEPWPGGALGGCFNPSVPLSHTALTPRQPW